MTRAWVGSTRRSRLPKTQEWERRRRAAIRKAGGKCQLRIPGVCVGVATQADHVNDDDDHSAIQASCRPCNQAKNLARRGRAPSERRPVPPHPGLVER